MNLARNLATVAAVVLPLGGFASCAHDEYRGARHPNQRPVVRILAGVGPDSTSVSPRVTFRWHGHDDDGAVVGFEYAIDDTSGGAWHDTTATSATFVFRVGDALGIRVDDPSRWHRFSVRAVDDDHAHSAAVSSYFNVHTIAPTTRIDAPSVWPPYIRVCPSFEVHWTGFDYDGGRAELAPASYEYKLARLPASQIPEGEVRDSIMVGINHALGSDNSGDPSRWTRVGAEVQSLGIDSAPGSAVAFAVRAIDEAGVRDPDLEYGRNLAVWRAMHGPEYSVTLSLVEPTLGSFTYPLSGQEWRASGAVGQSLRFKYWLSTSGERCGEVVRVRFALNIPDPESEFPHDPDGVGGWTDWRTAPGTINFVLPPEDGAALHTLWAEVGRHSAGIVVRRQRFPLHLQAVVFTQDKFALWVDDARYDQVPRDSIHDAWLQQNFLVGFHELGVVDQLQLFGTSSSDEPDARQPIELPDTLLARYQNVIWNSVLGSNTHVTGLYRNERQLRRLSLAAAGGTRFLVFGGSTVTASAGSRPSGGQGYPMSPPWGGRGYWLGFTDDTFLFRILHYRTWVVSVPSAADGEQKQASGMMAARSRNPSFPDLNLNPSKWDPWRVLDCMPHDSSRCQFKGGLTRWEGLRRSTTTPDLGEGFETLYEVETFNQFYDWRARTGIPVQSEEEGAIVGHRYQSTHGDTLAGTAQPRTVVFGFDPYFFDDGATQSLGRSIAHWLVNGRD